jgi:hypothetical protein
MALSLKTKIKLTYHSGGQNIGTLKGVLAKFDMPVSWKEWFIRTIKQKGIITIDGVGYTTCNDSEQITIIGNF